MIGEQEKEPCGDNQASAQAALGTALGSPPL